MMGQGGGGLTGQDKRPSKEKTDLLSSHLVELEVLHLLNRRGWRIFACFSGHGNVNWQSGYQLTNSYCPVEEYGLVFYGRGVTQKFRIDSMALSCDRGAYLISCKPLLLHLLSTLTLP